MLWPAAGLTAGSVAVGILMHCGRWSPAAATAPSEPFSVSATGQKDTDVQFNGSCADFMMTTRGQQMG